MSNSAGAGSEAFDPGDKHKPVKGRPVRQRYAPSMPDIPEMPEIPIPDGTEFSLKLPHQRWEYQAIPITTKIDDLNALGRDRWQVAATYRDLAAIDAFLMIRELLDEDADQS